MAATDKQISFLTTLVAKSRYASVVEACDAYGLGLRGINTLSVSEASEMISWLKAEISGRGAEHKAENVAAEARFTALKEKYPNIDFSRA